MPVHTSKDSKGCFAQWGGSGKKYYYTCNDATARKAAKAKAAKQGAAAHAAGYNLQVITANITGMIRNDRMEDRDYLVVPMIMLVEGVHDGSNGPLYYPADELAKTPEIWNHKPVIVYHPSKNGLGISACDPDILSNRKVGVIMNTIFEGEDDNGAARLKAEAWLEVDRVNKVDDRIATAIENNEMMELSTGLFTDNEVVEGEWYGEHYDAIVHNLRPDHLALLPDLKGACSIEDGAGFLRLNEEGDFVLNPQPEETENYIRIRQKNPGLFKEGSFRTITISSSKGIKAVIGRLKKPPKGQAGSAVVQTFLFDKKKWTMAKAKKWVKDHKPTANELGYNEIRTKLSDLLRQNDDYVWVEDVWDEFFIFEKDGRFFKQNYTLKDEEVSVSGLTLEVKKDIRWLDMSDNVVVNENGNIVVNKDKEKVMDEKKKIVDNLISSKTTKWEEANREWLMTQEEDILQNMLPLANQEEDDKDKDDKDKAADDKTGDDKTGDDKTADDKSEEEDETTENEITVDEYIKKAPTELQGVLRSGLAAHNATKAKLIKIVTSNKRNKFTKEQLQTKELDELRALAALATDPNYSGQGDPVDNVEEDEEEPMETPTMNFEEEKQKKTG